MTINSTTDGTYIVRLRTLSNQDHTMITDTLSKKLEEYNEQQFTTIGSVVGSTMKSRSITALILASIAIILYVAFGSYEWLYIDPKPNAIAKRSLFFPK